MRVRGHQRGFAIVAAIFIVVALGGLVTYMLAMAASQRQTANLAMASARALAAARAGIERQAYNEARAGAVADNSCVEANTTFTLNGATVTITCSVQQRSEGGVTVDVYSITSAAEVGTYGSAYYARRLLEVTLVVGN